MKYSPYAAELHEVFTIRHGHVNAPQAMADELIQAQLRIFALERKLEREERNASAGLLRRSPLHRSRQIKPQLVDPVDDEWIKTGVEASASSG
jgi:hypothetical protein